MVKRNKYTKVNIKDSYLEEVIAEKQLVIDSITNDGLEIIGETTNKAGELLIIATDFTSFEVKSIYLFSALKPESYPYHIASLLFVLREKGKVPFIEILGISSYGEGLGNGSILMEKLIEMAVEGGVEYIIAHLTLTGNPEIGKAFFDKFNFKYSLELDKHILSISKKHMIYEPKKMEEDVMNTALQRLKEKFKFKLLERKIRKREPNEIVIGKGKNKDNELFIVVLDEEPNLEDRSFIQLQNKYLQGINGPFLAFNLVKENGIFCYFIIEINARNQNVGNGSILLDNLILLAKKNNIHYIAGCKQLSEDTVVGEAFLKKYKFELDDNNCLKLYI